MLGGCLADFLEKVDVSKGGKTYKEINEQATRLFMAKIAYHTRKDEHYKVNQTLVADDYELWWDKVDGQTSYFPSYVVVSRHMADMLDRSMPLNLDTIKALGGNCMTYDLYSWLNIRHYTLAKPTLVNWEKLHEQHGSNYKNIRQFKAELKKAWQIIQENYTHNSMIIDKGIILQQSNPDIEVKTISSLKASILKKF